MKNLKSITYPLFLLLILGLLFAAASCTTTSSQVSGDETQELSTEILEHDKYLYKYEINVVNVLESRVYYGSFLADSISAITNDRVLFYTDGKFQQVYYDKIEVSSRETFD